MMDHSSRRQRLFYLIAIPCMLWVPVLTYLRHIGYPLFSAEVGILLLALGLAGLAIGLLMVISPRWLGALILAALLLLLLDIQYDVQTYSKLWIGVSGLAIAGVAMLLGRALPKMLAVVFSVLALSSLFVTAQPQVELAPASVDQDAAPLDDSLPPVLHIILDEHIALEAIPDEFDPGQTLAQELTAAYQERGLSPYSRVFSRFNRTRYSIPSALDFAEKSSSPSPRDHSGVFQLGPTALFQHWQQLGYKVRVFQSGYIGYCDRTMESPPEQCATYPIGNAKSILDYDDYDAIDRAELIARVFLSRCKLYEVAHKGARRITDSALGRAMGLPSMRPWNNHNAVSSLSTLPAIAAIGEALADAKPGEVFFAHLLLPHQPFRFYSDCSLRPIDQLYPSDMRARYLAYLQHVQCTTAKILKLIDTFDRAIGNRESIIVLHGDHGSRIRYAKDLETILVQDFATFFAARVPGEIAATVRTPMGLDDAMRRAYLGAGALDQTRLESPGWDKISYSHKKLSMQPFAFGQLTKDW